MKEDKFHMNQGYLKSNYRNRTISEIIESRVENIAYHSGRTKFHISQGKIVFS